VGGGALRCFAATLWLRCIGARACAHATQEPHLSLDTAADTARKTCYEEERDDAEDAHVLLACAPAQQG